MCRRHTKKAVKLSYIQCSGLVGYEQSLMPSSYLVDLCADIETIYNETYYILLIDPWGIESVYYMKDVSW